MADNRLNLIVDFTAIDKLSPALRNIIGLGKTGRQSLRDLSTQSRDLTKQIVQLGDKIKLAGKMGSLGIGEMAASQKALKSQLESVNLQITRQKRLLEIDGRTATVGRYGSKMVRSGMSTLVGAALVAAPIYGMAKSAGEVEGLQNQLRQFGLNNAAVSNLRNYADAMNVAGSSVKDNLHYIVEAQGIFRESGMSGGEQLRAARLMAPIMAKTAVASKALGQEFTDDEQQSTMRFIEMAGGLGSPRRAAALANIAFKLKQSSGGSVTSEALQTFMARGGSSVMSLRDSAYADYEPLIATLRDQAGVANYTAYKRLMGTQRGLPKITKAEFAKLGLWQNGQQTLNAGAAKILSEQGAVAFYQQVLLPAYKKAGIKDVQRENLLLMGGTGGTLYNEIDKANKYNTFEKSRAAYARSQGIGETYNQTKSSFFGAAGQMTAEWKNFLVAAGTKGGLLDMMVAGLHAATGALRAMTAAANNHPVLFRILATTVASLIGLRIVIASLKVTFGGMLGPLARVWGWFEKAGIIQRLVGGRAMGGLANILIGATQGFGGFGIVLEALTGPIGWIIGGVTLLAAGATLIYRNWSGISAFFHKHWTRLRNLFLTAMVLFTPFIAAFVWAVAKIYNNWGSIKAAFADGINWVKTKWTEFANWFGQTTLGKFLAAAGNIASGIGQGIKKYAGKALDSVGEFADDVGGRFANNLQIKSPSRVFMAFGQHIADGLAIGIDQHSNRPFRSMDRLGRGMTTSFANGGARGSRGGDVHHWHINQRDGEDGRTFARRVVRVMESHHRGDNLRSYRDDF